jgi:hypothetical protein
MQNYSVLRLGRFPKGKNEYTQHRLGRFSKGKNEFGFRENREFPAEKYELYRENP